MRNRCLAVLVVLVVLVALMATTLAFAEERRDAYDYYRAGRPDTQANPAPQGTEDQPKFWTPRGVPVGPGQTAAAAAPGPQKVDVSGGPVRVHIDNWPTTTVRPKNGRNGRNGGPGPKGDKGDKGDRGEKGEDGRDGQSAAVIVAADGRIVAANGNGVYITPAPSAGQTQNPPASPAQEGEVNPWIPILVTLIVGTAAFVIVAVIFSANRRMNEDNNRTAQAIETTRQQGLQLGAKVIQNQESFVPTPGMDVETSAIVIGGMVSTRSSAKARPLAPATPQVHDVAAGSPAVVITAPGQPAVVAHLSNPTIITAEPARIRPAAGTDEQPPDPTRAGEEAA